MGRDSGGRELEEEKRIKSSGSVKEGAGEAPKEEKREKVSEILTEL